MRSVFFAAAILASCAGSAVTYPKPTEPTYNQIERLIKAASNDTTPLPTNRVLYTRPTYSQIERLIKAISSCRNPGVEDLAYGSRYLSIWDCATGLPLSNMSNTTYRAGDFYIVGNTDTNNATSVAASGVYHHMVTFVNATTYSSQTCPMVVISFTNTTESAYTSFNDAYSAAREVYNGRSRMPAVGVVYRQDSDTEYDIVYGADPNASSTYGLGLCDAGGTAAWFLTGAGSVIDEVTDNAVRYVHTISGMSGSTASGGTYSGISLTITNTIPDAVSCLSDIACPAIMAGIKPDNVLTIASGSIQPDPSADVVSAYFTVDSDLTGVMILQDDNGGTGDAYKATDITSVSDTVTVLAPAGYASTSSDKLLRPSGASYVMGSASSEEESASVMPNDTYWYDGSSWVLISIASNMLSSSTTVGGSGRPGGLGSLSPASSGNTAEWAKIGSTPPITGVQLNGTMLSTNEDRVAIGTVRTCSPLPDGAVTGVGTSRGVSTVNFCKSIATNLSVVAGMMYLGQVRLTEGVDNPGVIPDLSEVTVKCVKSERNNLNPNDPEDFSGVVILTLEMTSTNQGKRHWVTGYELFGKKDWYNRMMWPNGKMSCGTPSRPWYGILYSLLDDQENAFNKIEDINNIAASQGDVTSITGIHAGEPTVKLQYKKGIWTNATECTSDRTVEIGVDAHATETYDGNQAIAIGRDAYSVGSATVVVGPNGLAEGDQAIAVGWRANAIGKYAIAVGSGGGVSQDYYADGAINPLSDLNLAEGFSSIAVGRGTKATGSQSIAIGHRAKSSADGAVQLGFGTNNVAHTLKFEDVTIVKNGQIVGATPEPESKDPSIGTTTDDMTLTVKPGSITTVLPATKLGPGSELAIHCTGMRNYTVYLPNEENVRQGLPVNVMSEIQRGTAQAVIGTNVFTRLPIRLKAEQPYNGLAVVDTTSIDDGYDWTPAVTNCLIVYNITSGKFCCQAGVLKSLEGVSLQAGTEYKMAYPLNNGGGTSTNTVSLMTVPAGRPFMDATFYGEVGTVEYTATSATPFFKTDGDRTYVDVKITYKTVNGECTFDAEADVVE